MMDISTSIAGIKLKNPLMPAAGPLTGSLEKMLELEKLGVSCMVAKTISIEGAKVPRPCITSTSDSVMNAELWSEYPLDFWLKDILPELKNTLKIPLMISVGYTKDDMEVLIPKLDKYADSFEVSTHYVGKDLNVIGSTVKKITELTQKPVFMKVSPHIPDVVEFAKVVRENGASGIVAINSLGPAMRINIKERKVEVGNDKGEVWVSGPVIKPLSLALIHRIRSAMPDFTVIGTGGITSAEDVLEFLLCGADAVQMLSSAMIKGRGLYKKIIDDIPSVLKNNNFESIEEVIQTKLKIPEINYMPVYPKINDKKCTGCGLCGKVCPYFAIKVNDAVLIDKEKCFGCGLCQSRCPSRAIYGIY